MNKVIRMPDPPQESKLLAQIRTEALKDTAFIDQAYGLADEINVPPDHTGDFLVIAANIYAIGYATGAQATAAKAQSIVKALGL